MALLGWFLIAAAITILTILCHYWKVLCALRSRGMHSGFWECHSNFCGAGDPDIVESINKMIKKLGGTLVLDVPSAEESLPHCL